MYCSVAENYHEQPQDCRPCSCFYSTFPILTFLWNTVAMKYDGGGNLLTYIYPYSAWIQPWTLQYHLSQTRFPCQTPSSGSYILTLPRMAQMNVKCVFSASDVQNKRYRQIATKCNGESNPSPSKISHNARMELGRRFLFTGPSRPGRQYINYTTDERRRVCCRWSAQ